MVNLSENKLKANELRKSAKYTEAASLYRELWALTNDKFDGAGLLHCLRKLELFDEAIPLADELIKKYSYFEWAKREIIWTYIQGILLKYDNEDNIQKVEEIANQIMNLNPENIAKKTVVFKVLKVAKNSNNWEKVNEWIVKIEPNILSINPSVNELGKEGWSDQSQWYNYRIRGFYEVGRYKEAIALVDEIGNQFPKQNKFFLRLKALSLSGLGRLEDAEKLYSSLCRQRPDWWMLHEYANILKSLDKNDEALIMMCKAALACSKLQNMISLFENIGIICEKMYLYKEARAHHVLCKHIRIQNGWNLPSQLIEDISSINEILHNENEQKTLNGAYGECKLFWNEHLSAKHVEIRDSKPKIRNNLNGKIKLGPSYQKYCFIISEHNEAIFCYREDLPVGSNDGDKVIFDSKASFDKKKNQESWKACNVKKVI